MLIGKGRWKRGSGIWAVDEEGGAFLRLVVLFWVGGATYSVDVWW